MGLTLTQVNIGNDNDPLNIMTQSPVGSRFGILAFDVAFDNSYLAGGEVIDFSSYLNSDSIIGAVFVPEDTQGYVIKYLPDGTRTQAGGKLKVYYGNYDAADGVLIDVPNATDISALSAVRVLLLGVL
jgi:hypothetical protein